MDRQPANGASKETKAESKEEAERCETCNQKIKKRKGGQRRREPAPPKRQKRTDNGSFILQTAYRGFNWKEWKDYIIRGGDALFIRYDEDGDMAVASVCDPVDEEPFHLGVECINTHKENVDTHYKRARICADFQYSNGPKPPCSCIAPGTHDLLYHANTLVHMTAMGPEEFANLTPAKYQIRRVRDDKIVFSSNSSERRYRYLYLREIEKARANVRRIKQEARDAFEATGSKDVVSIIKEYMAYDDVVRLGYDYYE